MTRNPKGACAIIFNMEPGIGPR